MTAWYGLPGAFAQEGMQAAQARSEDGRLSVIVAPLGVFQGVVQSEGGPHAQAGRQLARKPRELSDRGGVDGFRLLMLPERRHIVSFVRAPPPGPRLQPEPELGRSGDYRGRKWARDHLAPLEAGSGPGTT